MTLASKLMLKARRCDGEYQDEHLQRQPRGELESEAASGSGIFICKGLSYARRMQFSW